MTWEWPWLAATAVPSAALWWWLLGRSQDKRATNDIRYPDAASLLQTLRATSTWLHLPMLLRTLSIALLLLSLARPYEVLGEEPIKSEGIDIMLVLDTSGSMKALDLDHRLPIKQRRTRLEVVQDVVTAFVGNRPQDQIGLVVFGDHAFTQSPLTLDHATIPSRLEELKVGMVGKRTAIGDALGIALKRLERSPNASQVVVLLTDGLQTAGSLTMTQVADIASERNIKVYTIGVGTRGEAPFLTDGLFGQRVVYEEMPIDEEALRELADATGGTYTRAETADELSDVYQEIDRLERSTLESTRFIRRQELYPWFAFPAFLLMCVELVLRHTRFRSLP